MNEDDISLQTHMGALFCLVSEACIVLQKSDEEDEVTWFSTV